mmetsp:Transcript_60139/g.129109  ORF Transcript_60139/g.129109 Transcript_60139/m.129109 type:complete len:246 (+) Transcript_60139:374-1111(+)
MPTQLRLGEANALLALALHADGRWWQGQSALYEAEVPAEAGREVFILSETPHVLLIDALLRHVHVEVIVVTALFVLIGNLRVAFHKVLIVKLSAEGCHRGLCCRKVQRCQATAAPRGGARLRNGVALKHRNQSRKPTRRLPVAAVAHFRLVRLRNAQQRLRASLEGAQRFRTQRTQDLRRAVLTASAHPTRTIAPQEATAGLLVHVDLRRLRRCCGGQQATGASISWQLLSPPKPAAAAPQEQRC